MDFYERILYRLLNGWFPCNWESPKAISLERCVFLPYFPLESVLVSKIYHDQFIMTSKTVFLPFSVRSWKLERGQQILSWWCWKFHIKNIQNFLQIVTVPLMSCSDVEVLHIKLGGWALPTPLAPCGEGGPLTNISVLSYLMNIWS